MRRTAHGCAVLFATLVLAGGLAAAENLLVEVQPQTPQVLEGGEARFDIAIKNASNGNPANLNGRRVDATFPNATTPVALTSTGNATFSFSKITQGSGTQTLTVSVHIHQPQLEAALQNQIAQLQDKIAALQAELANTTNPLRRLVLQLRIAVTQALVSVLQGQLAQLQRPLATGAASVEVAAAPMLITTAPSNNQFVGGNISVLGVLTTTLPGKARLVVDGAAGALTPVNAGLVTLPLDTTALADGPHALRMEFVPDAYPTLAFASQGTNIKVDNTPPVLSNLQPAGAFTKHTQPAFSASYADAGSGVDRSEVKAFINDVDVTAQAAVQAAGVSFTPATPLAEGTVTWKVRVKDIAGNATDAQISFVLDATPPNILALGVAPKAVTNNPRPGFSAAFADDRSGVDATASDVLLDGVSVKANAILTESSLTFTPAADLSEGVHILSVRALDRAGNETVSNLAVRTDYTPPAAPTVGSIVATVDRVTVSGPTEADVVKVIAAAEGANVESAIIASYVVVFAKTGSQSFTGTIRLEDEAGNIGPALQQQFSFQNGGGDPPPAASISEFNLAVPAGKQKIEEGGKVLTDSNEVKVTFAVSGGTAPFVALVNGITATRIGTVGSIFEVTLANLPEGETSIEVDVIDNANQTAMRTEALICDTAPPEIDFIALSDQGLPDPNTLPVDAPGLSQAQLSTAPLGFLFLNGMSAAEAANVRAAAALPRNVYSRATCAMLSRIVDRSTALSAGDLRMELRAIGTASGGMVFPFEDFYAKFAASIPGYLQQPALSSPASTTLTSASSQLGYLAISNLGAGLNDSNPAETQVSTHNSYLLTVHAADRLGHQATKAFWFKVDTQAPEVLNNENPPIGMVGPLRDIRASFDTVRILDATDRPLLKSYNAKPGSSNVSPWLLPELVYLSNNASAPTTIPFKLEDCAGNTSQRTVAVFHSGNGATLSGASYFEATPFGSAGRLVGDPRSQYDATLSHLDPPNFSTADYIELRNITANGQNCIVKSPSWEQGRWHYLNVEGHFPFATPEIRFPEQTLAGLQGLDDPNYWVQKPTLGSYSMALGDLSTQLFWTYTGLPEIRPENFWAFQFRPSGFTPAGLQEIFLRYQWQQEHYQPEELAPNEYYPTFVIDAQAYKTRAIPLLEVTPDVLVAGRQTKIRVRGYFGADKKPGDLVPVSFSPSTGDGSGQGVLNIIPVDANGVPVPNSVPAPAGNGRVVYEDPFNATAMQTVEILTVPTFETAGIFDLNVNGNTLPRVLWTISVRHQNWALDSQGNATEQWEAGFDTERTRPFVTITNPADGVALQVTQSFEGLRTNVRGTVYDLVARLHGTPPTLTINNQAVSLTSTGNGGFSFDAEVSLGEGIQIRAIATNAFGVPGIREVITAPEYPDRSDLLEPVTPPQTIADLDSNLYVFPKTHFKIGNLVRQDGQLQSFDLTQTNFVTGTATTTNVTLAGNVLDEDGIAPVPVYMDPTAALRVKLSKAPIPSATRIEYILADITTTAQGQIVERTVELIEEGLDTSVFHSQTVEIQLTSAVQLSEANQDSLALTLYKPFHSIATATLLESANGSFAFTDANGNSVQLFGFSAVDAPLMVAIVNHPGLGLVNVPVLVRSDAEAETPELQARNFTSSRLVLQLPEAGANPPADVGAVVYRSRVSTYADNLPAQRAKRLVIKTGFADGLAEFNIKTVLGLSHQLQFSLEGDQLVSAPFAVDEAATGPGKLSGFPIEINGDTRGPGDEKKTIKVEDDPEVVEVVLQANGTAGSVVFPIFVRRLPAETPGGTALSEGHSFGQVNFHVPFQDKPGLEVKKADEKPNSIRVDASTVQLLQSLAVTWDGTKFGAEIDALSLLSEEERQEYLANKATLPYELQTQLPWPSSLTDWGNATLGFGAGMAEEALSNINPVEMIRGLVALASIDWSKIEVGSIVREMVLGDIEAAIKAAKAKNWYEFGFHSGRVVFFYGSLIPGAGTIGAKAAAKFAKVLNAYKIVKRPGEFIGGGAGALQKYKIVKRETRFSKKIPYIVYKDLVGPKQQRPGIRAIITKDILDTGTDANRGIRPPGFVDGDAGHSRGHLLAKRLGGSGDDARNLVTIHQTPTNSPQMRDLEGEVYSLVAEGKTVEYHVKPNYRSELGEIPHSITIKAWADGKLVIDTTIVNRSR